MQIAQYLDEEESARLYRLMAETIPHIVWTARADGSLDFFNRRCYDYTGLDASGLSGWAWKSVIHPEDCERTLSSWARALQSGERFEIEYRLRRADGAYRWHQVAAVPLRDAEGRVARWFGTCTDIELQIQSARILESMVAERTRELRAAKQRLGAIIETEPECVKLLDAQGRLLEMNGAGLRMIEAGAFGEVAGRCVYDLVAEEHREAFRRLTERVCRGERGSLEFELLGLRGTRRWLETHAVPFVDESSGATRLLAVTRDVTERKRAERALRDNERRFHLFMDNLPALAWIRDAELRYTYVNRRYAAERGGEPAEFIGARASDFFPQETARLFEERDREVRARGVPVQYVDQFPPGRWLKIKFPLPDPAGGIGVAGIALDITERVRLEEALAESESRTRGLIGRLIAARESERRQLADELHDLIGQNLTALGIDLMALKPRLPAGDAAGAARLEAMRSLVEGTINSIRGVMTGLRPPALEEFGLVPALRAYTADFAERTQIRVALTVIGPPCRLPAELDLALFRIVQEALTNAAKHSGAASARIEVETLPGRVRVAVADDGCGFADQPGARGSRGGWGVPEMRERAEAHGGTLHIVSSSSGTRVTAEIPVIKVS
jgi:PAS domain S-box-containing protein